MRLSPLEKKLYEISNPIIEDFGFKTVLVKSYGQAGDFTIQIMAENPATGRLGVDDCAKISRAVAAILDVEDPIDGAYKLEISSPGIDRPLVNIDDYKKFKSFEAKIEIDMPLDNGQKRFRGFIKDTKDDVIILDTDTGDIELPLSSIIKSKLVLTDRLIEATAKK